MTGQLRFDGRVAIVTGAGQGLGRAYADLLAERGAAVVVNDLGGPMDGAAGSSGLADQAAEEIRAAGGTACADRHSVATEEGAAAIVATALDAFGRVDIVINNAGTINRATLPETTLAQFEALLAVHLGGTFLVTRAAWPHLARQGYGRVLLTSSVGGMVGFPDRAVHYAAAKGAAIGMTTSLANEGEPLGIHVNGIAPGGATRMSDGSTAPAVAAWFERHMRPALVAPVAAWLVHEDCDVNGHVYSAAGGYAARLFLAETWGHHDPDLTIEAVRDHVAQIEDQQGYVIPTRHNRFDLMLERLGVEPPEVPGT